MTNRPRTGGGLWAFQARAAPYLFLSPFVLLFLIFLLYPLGRSLQLSFYKTLGPAREVFVGWENYRFMVQDRVFWGSVANTVSYAALYLCLQVPLSLGLAILLNRPKLFGRNVLRFIFFSTHLVGAVFVATLFANLLRPKTGPVSKVFAVFGVQFDVLTDPRFVMFAVLITSLWVSVGFGMMYCLAALQNVDRELYEASSIDGASPARQFWHVTLPGVRPVLSFLTLVGMISSLQLFEIPYIIFSGAGPDNRALTIVMHLFTTGFEQGDLGYAAAIGWALVVLVGGATLLLGRGFVRGGGR